MNGQEVHRRSHSRPNLLHHDHQSINDDAPSSYISVDDSFAKKMRYFRRPEGISSSIDFLEHQKIDTEREESTLCNDNTDLMSTDWCEFKLTY